MLNSESVTHPTASWRTRVRVADRRLRERSLILHGLVVALVSAASIYATSKLLDPLVFYGYWNAICWPIDGLVIGVMLMCHRRNWPWIMVGYVLAIAPGRIGHGVSILMTAIDNLCNILEMSTAAFSLPAFTGLSEWLRSPKLILRFSVFAVIGAPLLPAIVWSAFNVFYSGWAFWPVVRRWESGDVLTIALFAPLVFVLVSKETRLLFRTDRLRETLILFTILIAAIVFVFHQRANPLAFILFPVLVLIASRLGFPGAVLAVNILNLLGAKATIEGNGPFMLVRGEYEPQRALTLQIYLTLAMVTSFGIALTALERNDFQNQLKEALQKMQKLATQDGLTGLGNRRLFDLTLESEWGRSGREADSISLLLLDADCFKSYNDLYGHIAGDKCLCAIADCIRINVKRGGELAARYGGEEFVVLLPGVTLNQANVLAEAIRQSVELMRIEHAGNPGRIVTVSIGCSALVADLYLPSQLLVAAADEALYAAKQRGRNRVECAGILTPLSRAPAVVG